MFLLLLIFFSSETFSQDLAVDKLRDLRLSGNIDSIYLKTTYYKNLWYKHSTFLKEPLSDWVYIYKDTVYEKNGDYEIGMVTLDTVYQFLHTRIGAWSFYYSNGSTKAKGYFRSGATIWCSPIGPNLNIYSYKTGDWKFWHPNGQIMANGLFLNKKEKFENECEGGDYRTISKINSSWKFFNTTGKRIKTPSHQIIRIIDEIGLKYLSL